MGIEACKNNMPGTPMVTVFDTSFFHNLPKYAHMFPISADLAEKHSIRKYGAHGTSHRYLTQRAAELLGKDVNDVNLITCHLGNGASISAIKGGKAVDTSMGLTPLDGVMMGTRCGGIDPAIFTVPDGSLYEFCYCPGYNGDIILELSELFNYVLQIINYEDDKAVRLAYEIHQRVQAEYFTINDIMDALNENTNLVPLKIEDLDDELIEFEEVEMTPFVEEESNKTFFERVALYLKGRNLIDVLDDINNKEFMYKVNEYGSGGEQYLLSQSLMEDADGYSVKSNTNVKSDIRDSRDYASGYKENLLDEIEFVNIR